MIFYLGIHHPHWCYTLDVPVKMSARRLRKQKRWSKSNCNWVLDSGGFSELSIHGKWTVSAKQYVDEVRRWQEQLGRMSWAAVQDWMCEDFILAKTGRTLRDHQNLTVGSFFELEWRASDIKWLPVLQGQTEEDYFRHLGDYERAGVSRTSTLFGLGSICRRQGTKEALRIIENLHRAGVRLHGFGFKVTRLQMGGIYLASADSMVWSFAARKTTPLPGCTHTNCANCKRYAIAWRDGLIAKM